MCEHFPQLSQMNELKKFNFLPPSRKSLTVHVDISLYFVFAYELSR